RTPPSPGGGARDTPRPGCGRRHRRGRTGGPPHRAAALDSMIRPSRLSPLANRVFTRTLPGGPARLFFADLSRRLVTASAPPRSGPLTPDPAHWREDSRLARPTRELGDPGRHRDLKLRTLLQGTMTRTS